MEKLKTDCEACMVCNDRTRSIQRVQLYSIQDPERPLKSHYAEVEICFKCGAELTYEEKENETSWTSEEA